MAMYAKYHIFNTPTAANTLNRKRENERKKKSLRINCAYSWQLIKFILIIINSLDTAKHKHSD